MNLTASDRTDAAAPPGWVAAACALTAAAFAALWLVEEVNPVRTPVLPFWCAAGLAGSATVLVLGSGREPARWIRSRFALGVAVWAAMLLGSVAAVPHTVLMIVVWATARVTGGTGSFDADPRWPVAAAYLLNLGASLILGRWLLLGWRERRGRCRSCGRVEAAPPRAHLKRLPWLAAAAVVACLPYGLLKLAWSFGSRLGLTGHAFDDVSFASPGFGDTVVLTLVSVVVSVVMGAAVQHRIVRGMALGTGALGSVMLLPVGLVGGVMLALASFTGQTIDDSEIALWAFVVVYASFLSWGIALTALTLDYWRTSRPTCNDAVHRAGGMAASGEPVSA